MSDAMDTNQRANQTLAHKGAKLAVIILSALIILALIALVAGAILKLGNKAPAPSGAPGQVFALAPGAKITSMDSQPGRLILRVRKADGEEIDIIDTANGHLVGQVQTTPAK
jgi:hypothetical protein